ncbi:MAG: tetratricopeptide repeat protein, partial [Kiritimatiellae bacterium]|nr:tetratricopeptide repeat protein [Kiritimatiellia bacterium]
MSKLTWKQLILWMYFGVLLILLVRNVPIAIRKYSHRQMVIGWEHYQGEKREKDNEKAVAHSLRAARLGNRIAKNNLGMFYARGDGVEQDLERAYDWLQRAEKGARTGNTHYNLGYMFYSGKGVPQDDEQARYYFEQSAERDFPLAHWYLGEIYRLGRGVEVAPEKAFHHYWQAAMLGQGPGFRSTGWCYWTGEGVERDPVKAYALTLLSVTYSGAFPYTELMEMAAEMAPHQIERAEHLSKELSAEYAVP